MEIVGKIIYALEPQSGTSKSGNPWHKREYVLETQEQYPKKVFFNFFGQRADQYPLEVGQMIRLSFDLNSREYNGRWYLECSGWKAEQVNPADLAGGMAAAAPAPQVQFPQGASQMPGGYAQQPNLKPEGGADDLPF